MQHKFHSMEEQPIAPADNDNHDRQLTAVAIGDDATHVLDQSSERAQPDATDPARRSPASPPADVTTGDNDNQARLPTIDRAADVHPPEQERSAADDGAAGRLATMEEDASNADDDSRADASAEDYKEGGFPN